MKRILLSALFIVPTLVIGQFTLIDENFDSYSDQDYAGDESPIISTWSGNTGAGTDDCLVTSSESSSPSNSITITGPQAGGSIDAMVAFPSDYTTGSYDYSMKFKVATGMGGYFNCHSTSSPPDRWMLQVYFASDGTGGAEMGGDSIIFNYPNGEWVDIVVSVDLDADFAQFFVGGTEVGTGFIWSTEAFGGGTGNAQFGGVNLYSASGDPTADCEYYVDDILLIDNTGVATGVEDLNNASAFTIFPNPATTSTSIEISLDNKSEVAVSVLDLLGKEVATKNYGVLSTSSVINLNTTDYPTGIYLDEVSVNGQKATKKLVIE
ncbi:T9SS type A sorting domain-containing protein [Flavobacteriales bacterium]|nr:T9SS type A sorting domain-containing protein [Flavobacteriales bacterium]